MSINLNDILNFQDLKKVKIRFNQSNGSYDPLRFFKEDQKSLLNGQFWNYNKKKSFKNGDITVGFIKLRNHKWLLFDISIITKDLNLNNAVGYEYETCKEYEKYFGRLIIEFRNKSQNLIRNAESVIDQCSVIQILEDTFDNDLFPGYENVRLEWKDLRRIVSKSNWITALENQKAVYLITDKSNGKMYIGSAYGETMLLGRWKSYVNNGHGGNVELKNIEFDHIQNNFEYSILDIYKSTINDEVIINRESWWKETLLTRKFGYNRN